MKEVKDLAAIFANPVALSFEAEESALVSKEYMLRVCCPALQHEKSYVREGALYGMAHFMDDIEVRAMVVGVAESDPDDVVRDIAIKLLQQHEPYPGMEFEMPVGRIKSLEMPEPCRALLKHVGPNNYITIDVTI